MRGSDLTLTRKHFLTHPLWLKPRVFSEWEAWIDMLQMAAWEPIQRDAMGITVTLARGEFIASLRFLSVRWHWTVKRIRLGLKRALADGRIRAQSQTSIGMIYRIVEYDAYKDNLHWAIPLKGTPAVDERAERGHSEGTNNSSYIDLDKDKISVGRPSNGKRNGSIPQETLTDEPNLQWE